LRQRATFSSDFFQRVGFSEQAGKLDKCLPIVPEREKKYCSVLYLSVYLVP
jgi:hypothetical protein